MAENLWDFIFLIANYQNKLLKVLKNNSYQYKQNKLKVLGQIKLITSILLTEYDSYVTGTSNIGSL